MFLEITRFLAGGSQTRRNVRCAASLMVVACLAITPANAQDRSQGRSMVISRGGIVAAESPLAA